MDKKNAAIIILALFSLYLIYGTSQRTTMEERDFESTSGGFAGAPSAIAPSPLIREESAKVAFEAEAPSPTTDERKIIQTGYMSVEVKDFMVSSRAIESIAAGAGGFVSSSNAYVTEGGQKRGTTTIRVPSDKFKDALDKLEAIGDVKSKSVSGEDVTEEFIDLEARLSNYEKQEKRLLEILDKAITVEDILKVEAQLERVRGEIERITGRLKFLKNRVDLATITVDLFEPVPISQSFGIRNALSQAVEEFISSVNGLIIATGGLLPIAFAALVLYWVYRAVKKRGILS